MAVALRLAFIITLVEYIARRFLRYLFPQVGTLLVNDMLVMALAYTLLVSFVAKQAGRSWRSELRTVAEETRRFPRDRLFWYALAAFGGATLFALPMDSWLASRVTLPAVESPIRSETVWLAEWRLVLGAVSLLLVNGVWVPIAEELLWRGHVQPQLQASLPLGAAITLTAVLFSLKHAVVDASLGRFFFITAFGLIVGFVAARRRWQAAAVLHMTVNILATTLILVARLLVP